MGRPFDSAPIGPAVRSPTQGSGQPFDPRPGSGQPLDSSACRTGGVAAHRAGSHIESNPNLNLIPIVGLSVQPTQRPGRGRIGTPCVDPVAEDCFLVVTGREELPIRMWFVNGSTRSRRRGTDRAREWDRLARSIAITLGQGVRSGRTRLRLTQKTLAARIGVDATRISQIEAGRGQGVPVRTWIRIGFALDQPLAVSFSRPLSGSHEPSDAGHLAMQERLLELARASGRTARFELPTRPEDPRHSIDVCVRDDRQRVLIIEEAWNKFGDVGAAIRNTNRKTAEAANLAGAIAEDAYRVATVWVVRPTDANRLLLGRYPEVFRSAFPGSSRAWVQALESGAVPPYEPGLVWLDPVNRRTIAWRRQSR